MVLNLQFRCTVLRKTFSAEEAKLLPAPSGATLVPRAELPIRFLPSVPARPCPWASASAVVCDTESLLRKQVVEGLEVRRPEVNVNNTVSAPQSAKNTPQSVPKCCAHSLRPGRLPLRRITFYNPGKRNEKTSGRSTARKAMGKKCSTTRKSTAARRGFTGRRPRSGAATGNAPRAGTHVQGRMTVSRTSTKKSAVGREASAAMSFAPVKKCPCLPTPF